MCQTGKIPVLNKNKNFSFHFGGERYIISATIAVVFREHDPDRDSEERSIASSLADLFFGDGQNKVKGDEENEETV